MEFKQRRREFPCRRPSRGKGEKQKLFTLQDVGARMLAESVDQEGWQRLSEFEGDYMDPRLLALEEPKMSPPSPEEVAEVFALALAIQKG